VHETSKPLVDSSAHSLNGGDAVQNRSRCALKFSCDYWTFRV
jgi:hypothetical protein